MTEEQVKDILIENGSTFIEIVDKDTIRAIIDGDWEVFNRADQYSGHPLSGFATYGSVSGDHRMISHIYNEMQELFALLSGD